MELEPKQNIFLFSIDLEDVRMGVGHGNLFKERVPFNTHVYLKWLNDNNSKCTFFVVGQVAEMYPSIIDEIVKEGHEIACHTMVHKILSNYTPSEFDLDLQKNIEVLYKAGAVDIRGFRAPSYSLNKNTSWAYPILKRHGIEYSSSVLPARNPLFNGWPDHIKSPATSSSGILEIPLTVGKIGILTIPILGGIYFRTLPVLIIKSMIKFRRYQKDPLVGYMHPFDIDTEQEKFMHGGINNNRFYNWLMYYNRGSVFSKLDSLLEAGYKISPYANFSSSLKVK